MRDKVAYPYKSLHKYPGMRPRDVAIWDQFIINHPGAFERVWYDVHVGDPVDDPRKDDEMRKSGMFDVSCWCIDVVAETRASIYIIEVKPNALAGALGQALAYTKFAKRLNMTNKPLIPVVLTDNISPITLQAAEMLRVILLTP